MKTRNLNLKALILILVLSLTGQSYAHNTIDKADEKKVLRINMKAPLVKFITSTLDISSEDLANLKEQMKEAQFLLVSSDSMEIEFTLVDSNDADSYMFIELGKESNPLEDWMYDDEYLNTESVPAIENWMSDDEYLNTESAPAIEEWMLNDDYLNTEAAPEIEDWMMSDDYYSTEATPEIEGWMMSDDHYSTECCPVIEDWMMDGDYLNAEATPEIENWMMD